jgi:hypothetical protein
MADEIKQAVDVTAATTGGLVFFDLIQPIAGLFTIIWLAIRIFETATVQRWLGR